MPTSTVSTSKITPPSSSTIEASKVTQEPNESPILTTGDKSESASNISDQFVLDPNVGVGFSVNKGGMGAVASLGLKGTLCLQDTPMKMGTKVLCGKGGSVSTGAFLSLNTQGESLSFGAKMGAGGLNGNLGFSLLAGGKMQNGETNPVVGAGVSYGVFLERGVGIVYSPKDQAFSMQLTVNVF